MVKNNLKKGFSLAEALIVMVIVSIFFAMATKVITTRPKPKKQVNEHGYYECYFKGSTLYQRYVKDDIPPAEIAVTACTFEPPTGVGFFNINTYGNIIYSSMEPNINQKLKINITANQITISSVNGSYPLTNNINGSDVIRAREIQKEFLGSIYANSKLFNNGNPRVGILISW